MARRFRSLTPERVDDLPGSCACCTLWIDPGASEPRCAESCDRDRFIEWMDLVRREWGECGRIAYEGGEVLGFVRYAPARFLPGAAMMPTGAPDDDAVLLACLHVSATARHAGLGKVLLQAALSDLKGRGEKAIEAYAVADRVDRAHSPLVTVEFLLRQGFTVCRPHPRYPLMRLELKSLAAWAENIEAVLEALQMPVGIRERVPAARGTAIGCP